MQLLRHALGGLVLVAAVGCLDDEPPMIHEPHAIFAARPASSAAALPKQETLPWLAVGPAPVVDAPKELRTARPTLGAHPDSVTQTHAFPRHPGAPSVVREVDGEPVYQLPPFPTPASRAGLASLSVTRMGVPETARDPDCALELVQTGIAEIARRYETIGSISLIQRGEDPDPLADGVRAVVRDEACRMGGRYVALATSGHSGETGYAQFQILTDKDPTRPERLPF